MAPLVRPLPHMPLSILCPETSFHRLPLTTPFIQDATISQALSGYESTHSLPRGWLPYAATHASPDSSPSSLTRSSLSSALQSKDLWSSFNKPQNSLSQAAKTNRTMIGDPVSLKAEKADSSPTEQDRGAGGSGPATSSSSSAPSSQNDSKPKSGAEMRDQSQTEPAPVKKNWGSAPPPNDPPSGTKMQQKSLKQAAKENVTQLGDPVSLKAETADSEPTPDDKGARSEERVTETPAETRDGGSGGAGTAGSGRNERDEGPPQVDVDEVWGVIEKARGGKGNKAKI